MEVYMLMGLPGLGKSTLAKKIACAENAVIICMDDIITMVEGRYQWNDSHYPIYKKVEDTLIQSAAEIGRNIVLDRTLVRERDRCDFLRAITMTATDAKSDIEIKKYCFDFGCDTATALRRKALNPRGQEMPVWEKAIADMATQYENAEKHEGFDFIVTVDTRYYRTWAIDFDNTIVSQNYPDIGKENMALTNVMRKLAGYPYQNYFIINTCRSGLRLAEAECYLRSRNIPYDAINENPLFSTGSRKVYADVYVDDRNMSIKDFENVWEKK